MPDPQIDDALARATGVLPQHEDRPSQRAMAQAVATAVRENRHLIVQAGTGTGKSLAYLVPLLTLGTRAVISTATKALQDQLATRDLPRLRQSLGVDFEYAVLKGRSNYLCRQRLDELAGGDEQLLLNRDDAQISAGALGRELIRLARWATTAATGDRADLPWEPTDVAWAQVSVGARDCPGANRCPAGERCFAEAARRRALEADVVVVNTHLYTTALSIEGELLPPHDVVVFDEAHELEDIASSAFGFEISAGRLVSLARTAKPLLSEPSAATAVEDAAVVFLEAVQPAMGQALPRPLDPLTGDRFGLIRERVGRLLEEVRRAAKGGDGSDADPDGARARGLRVLQAGGHLLGDLEQVLDLDEAEVAWVEGEQHAPVLRVAPLDVGAAFEARLWAKPDGPVAVLTSATVPLRLAERLGVPAGGHDELDVGSPFDYAEQALLYCPVHLPDPRHENFEPAMHDELVALIQAAEGRTLALFTSWRAMRAAAEQVRDRVAWPILTQSDLPKPALIARFSSEEHSCLFATMGFWQGVDVPGSALSLVTIDRLPFARPDNPLLQARRAQAGRAAFDLIDIPRATTLLAQGTGRLIRTRHDRGVVAVFDTRLARASYRWQFIHALPPMRRTRHRAEVEAFLAPLREPAAAADDRAQALE